MAKYEIQLNGHPVAVALGVEYAFEVYSKTKELAELIVGSVDLVDLDTAECIAWWDFETGEGM